MRYKVGDQVMARWPGSSLYFKAQITNIDEDEGMADVRFEDGTDMDVPFNYLASEKVFARKKSKSPSRRRSRSRSPGRSPARQTRQRKILADNKAESKKEQIATSSSSEDTKMVKVTSDYQRVRQTTRTEVKVDSKDGVQKSTTTQYEAEVLLKKVNDIPKTIKIMEKYKTTTHSPPPKREFGGPFGVFFVYLTSPLLPLVMITACNSTSCELLKFKLSHVPQALDKYYDKTGAIIIAAYLLFHALIYALPFGYIADGPDTPTGKKTTYRISAFYTLFFSMAAFTGLRIYNYPIHIVLDKLFPLMAMCTLLSLVLNVIIHLKSWGADKSDLNPTANTGCTIYDMFFGRELHPRFGNYFQLKLFVYRPAMAAWIIIDLLYLNEEFKTGTVRPSIAVVVGCQILYCIWTFFLDELQAIYSFDIKYEGAGFMSIFGNFVMVPFIYTSHALYLIKHPGLTLPLPSLAMVVLLIVSGVCLTLLSGSQKIRFRLNQYDPQLSGLESIPPSKKGGDRLIVSGLWGFVRHPNYLGEVLMGLGYGLACGFHDIFPWIYAIFVTVLLCHRALRDDARCQTKHGYAWKEYCKRVPYRVIPFIF